MSESDLIQIGDFENFIEEEHLKYFDYKNFSHIEQIGIGGFGKVYRANWKNGLEKRLALKSFYYLDNTILKEIIHEVLHYNLILSKHNKN
jgi:hypothetical protein